MTGSPWLQLVPFVIVLPMIWIAARIVQKMGYSGWLVLLWMVPGVNLFFAGWLALTKWPIEREVKELRESIAVLQGARSA
jgi:hypothetical protein